MLEIQSSAAGLDEQGRPLTLFVHGGGTLYKAHCPELDISYYSETPELAEEGFYVMVRAEARGILEGIRRRGILEDRGGPDDRRGDCAELVIQTEEIKTLFDKNPGPPPHRVGLK